MQRIISDHYVHVNKMDNLEDIDKFLEMYNIPHLNQEEIENVKQSNHKQENQNCNKNIPTNKSSGPCGFMGFPESSVGKESAWDAEGLGLIHELGRPLEKGKTTHSSIVAWSIPWTMYSMGS